MMFRPFDREEFRAKLESLDTALSNQIFEDGGNNVRRALPAINKAALLGSFSSLNSYFPYLADFQSGGITYKYIAAVTITYPQAKYLVYSNKGRGTYKYTYRTIARYKNVIKNLVLLMEHPLRNENFLEMLTDRVMETPMMAPLPVSRDVMLHAITDFFRNNGTFARYDNTSHLYGAGVLPALFGLHMSEAENPREEGGRNIKLKPFMFELNEALVQVYRGKSHGNNGNHKVVAAR